jgi:hypothetical protein
MATTSRLLLGLVFAGALIPMSAGTITVTTGGSACGSAGVCTSQAGATTVNFDSASGSSYTSGSATYTLGSGSEFVTGTQWVTGDSYTAPLNDSTKYLAVSTNNASSTVTINFSSPISYFGMYVGSEDDYNSISFYSGSTLLGTISGGTLICGTSASSGCTSAWGDNSKSTYANFSFGGSTVTSVQMTSTSASFETDNHSYVVAPVTSVPEPATEALFGAGILLLGVMGKRLRRK